MTLTPIELLELDSLSSQFKILVLISTFTAALIISFLNFALVIIGSAKGRPYQFGMFFSVIGIGFHLFSALVAARAGMLCFRQSKLLHTTEVQLPTTDTRSSVHQPQLRLSDFQYFLVLCERLQFVGTTLYIPPALFLLFYMFHDMGFAIAIYVLTGIGAWGVYRLGFWRFSVLWQDFHPIYSRCKEVVLKTVGKF